MTDDWFSDETATFGDRLAAAREGLGLTQSQLASRLGVRLASVQNWEADRAEPRANKLQMLAGLLNVSIVWLLTGEGEGALTPAESENAEARSLIAELREIRLAQTRLTERLGRVEKRLRSLGTG
ncbi:MAG: helix-turn-helix domain-containing protein [Paracoccaceae bacterium]